MTLLLVFLSGFCALIYQVLWMKQLGLLFGNTSHAAGATLAAFFAGLAVGSWFWGRRSSGIRNPLRLYAGLELGIALTALLYFVVMRLFHALYPVVFQSVHSDVLLGWIRFLLALLLIFPPAFCMGGTIPVMGQHAIRLPARFGSTAALLYGVNTLGATLGALLAGFFMPLWFGFRMTCWIAIGLTLLVAALSLMASRRASAPMHDADPPGPSTPAGPAAGAQAAPRVERVALWAVCFLSGFGVLALEVLWTRMFSLVLENSVYTYAAILVVVLFGLSGGSMISSLLARRGWNPRQVLAALLLFSGLAVALTPTVFLAATDSFRFLAVKIVWVDFVLLVFQKCALTIGPPALVLGAVFPYLLKTQECHASSPGKTLGRMATINTVGAIVGSLACGFLMLESLGMWRSMQVIGLIYFGMAVAMAPLRAPQGIGLKVLGMAGLVLLFTWLNPVGLPATGRLEDRTDERTLKTWEGSDCTVSVVRGRDGLSIKINSDYGLGSTDGRVRQAFQAEIPLMLKPDARSIFFLGMGTGISAGAALSDQFPRVERVVTCELSPHVIAASREFITDVDGLDLTNGLFTDPRSEVLAEDGRHYLMATRERFDIINADLFVPYRSGAGSLYTLEHFRSVRERLKPDGIFVQWLPTYQLTEFQFHVIGRTMLEVFDQVSLWRCDFAPLDEVVALVGHKGGTPLAAFDLDDAQVKRAFLEANGGMDIHQTLNPQTALLYYCGNVTASRERFAGYPLNTDDRPVIEYQGPREYRNQGEEETPWFIGPRILAWIKELQEACPPEEDPLLIHRSPANRRLPLAGSAFHETMMWGRFGNEEQSERSWRRFVKEWLNL